MENKKIYLVTINGVQAVDIVKITFDKDNALTTADNFI